MYRCYMYPLQHITFSIFLSWVFSHGLVMMQRYVNHLRTISSLEVMIQMFENLDPQKMESLLPSIHLVTLRKDFVKTAALLLHSTHRIRGHHGGMGYAPFHPIGLSWIIEI